ncbi:MAG: heme A synthase [Chloroflexi bacterium]|nr:MAG: heme A synthase [Chloroflexota bacterium]
MNNRMHQSVITWLLIVCGLIVTMVVFGGYVRLTRSGLSIVEWNVVDGVLPPIGEAAWQTTFAQYQQTPEFQKVNSAMTLAEYRRIFYIEYIHRLLARIAGLVVILPLVAFVVKGIIPWGRSAVYWLIALLFVFQGFLGWYMVSSGLVDSPSVSPYRLTIHLLMALLVLGLTFWVALDRVYPAALRRPARGAGWAMALLVLVGVQIAYGGLVAGMKAGHLSDTFPRMFGYLVPPGLFAVLQPWWANLVADPTAVHFIHRWFAFVVLSGALVLLGLVSRADAPREVRWGGLLLGLLVSVQVGLGLSVIWLHVPLTLALLHQLTAVLLFLNILFLLHRLRAGAVRVASAQPEPMSALHPQPGR